MLDRTRSVLLAATVALVACAEAGGASWFDPAWSYRLKVAVDSAQVPAAQSDVPILVDLSRIDAGHPFWSHVRADCGDVVVVAADGVTRVPAEIVSFDANGRTGELWLRGNLLPSSDTP